MRSRGWNVGICRVAEKGGEGGGREEEEKEDRVSRNRQTDAAFSLRLIVAAPSQNQGGKFRSEIQFHFGITNYLCITIPIHYTYTYIYRA